MTPRQWNLRNLLATGNTYKTKEVMDCLKEYGDYDETKSDNYNSINIRMDVVALNESTETDKIAIFKIEDSEYFFRFARDEVEALEFAERYKEEAIKKFIKCSQIIRKAKNNGKMELISNKGNAIDEDSKAREYFEAYISQNKPLEEWSNADLELEYLRLCNLTHNIRLKLWREGWIKEIKTMRKELTC